MKMNYFADAGKTNPIYAIGIKPNFHEFLANFYDFLLIFFPLLTKTCAFGTNFLTKSQKTGQEQTFLAGARNWRYNIGNPGIGFLKS